MIIDCIADLHGHFPELPGGDLLIIAGDLTSKDAEEEYIHFGDWLRAQEYKEKIFIGGNHDTLLEKKGIFGPATVHFTYLQDSGTEFEGLKIWGSPWTKTFQGMNPRCKAFTMYRESDLDEKWEMIPEDTDILITHSPPRGVLDKIEDGTEVGSITLGYHVGILKPKLHVFGHIHECGGQQAAFMNVRWVNASHVDEKYRPVHEPVRVEL